MLEHIFHSRHIHVLPPKIRNFLLHIGRKRYRTNMLMLSTIIYFLAFYSFSSFIPFDAKMIFPSTSFFHSQNFGLNELRITMKVNHLLKQLNGYFGTWQVSFDIYRSERNMHEFFKSGCMVFYIVSQSFLFWFHFKSN